MGYYPSDKSRRTLAQIGTTKVVTYTLEGKNPSVKPSGSSLSVLVGVLEHIVPRHNPKTWTRCTKVH